MKTLLKPDGIALIPESEAETASLALWKNEHDDFAFASAPNAGKGAMISALGPRLEACRIPINVTSQSRDRNIRLIANFSSTPFDLDGIRYTSVESFWQSLRFPEAERPRIAGLPGEDAKRLSSTQPYGSHVRYADVQVPVGTWHHWQLMKKACLAKFQQNADAQGALRGTGTRPLLHKVRGDSRTIPGVIMADIWMAIRAGLPIAYLGQGH